jgi:hypothetical protein
MTSLNRFLKVLNKIGYPNPQVESIATMVDYDLDDFLMDLKNELGQEGVDSFCENAIKKLEGEDGIKVEFGYNEYAVARLDVIGFDEDESSVYVIVDLSILDSKLLAFDDEENETYKTLQQIGDDIDMGGWSDYEELKDSVLTEIYNHIHKNCGFGIWVH